MQVIKSSEENGDRGALECSVYVTFACVSNHSHATSEMQPEELFLRHHLHSRLSLTQPNHQPTIEQHQQLHKKHHDRSRVTKSVKRGHTVMVLNQREKKQCMGIRQNSMREGPVTYVVKAG